MTCPPPVRAPHLRFWRPTQLAAAATVCALMGALPAEAQDFRFTDVRIEGNQRVEAGTILSYLGVGRGQVVSAAELNDGYQRLVQSGLFETVEIAPRGGLLVIEVEEFPTISVIAIEGNRSLDDDLLLTLVESQSRRALSPSLAEADAARITEAYRQQGRLSARVQPRLIERSENRVDLVFEVFEGGVVEVERIGFVGNTAFSDSRLRRVLSSKQAGLFRALIQADTFVADRVEFDKQLLRDFYQSRGYVDFTVQDTNAELSDERDGYFVTFAVQEGQQFSFGEARVVSDLPEVDTDLFQDVVRLRAGRTYSPQAVEAEIERMERLAVREGLNFVRVEPRVTRNDRDLTLDIDFVLSRGPRVFIERIDIQGNTTTLDRVIRRQFDVVEGDPFNPRAIRAAADRIRALGFFGASDVNIREGSSPQQAIIAVDVEEQPTGSLSFGATYSSDTGFGGTIGFSENNFLGRGQRLSFNVATATSTRNYSFNFFEPAILGRNVGFGVALSYNETDNQAAEYDTEFGRLSPSFSFPVSRNGRLSLNLAGEFDNIVRLSDETGDIVEAEAATGERWRQSVGYSYSFDTRRAGLDPKTDVILEVGQDFGVDDQENTFIKSRLRGTAQTRVLGDDVTLRATFEGGALNYSGNGSRVTDRFFMGSRVMRGFEYGGIGPREVDATTGVNDPLGGNLFAVARLEAEFPLPVPEEYGISGGLFYDVGSLWGLDQTNANTLYDDFSARQVIGAALLWDTAIGPLRFNFTRALEKERFDVSRDFEFTISTQF